MRLDRIDERQPQLRRRRGQVAQPVQQGRGQIGAGHHDQREIRVGLGQQAGQRHMLEPEPAAGQAGGVVKIGPPVLDRRMIGLEPATAQIGKPAQSKDLHPHQLATRRSRCSRQIEYRPAAAISAAPISVIPSGRSPKMKNPSVPAEISET